MPSSFGLHYSFVIRHSAFVILPHMTPARLQRIEEIFYAALEKDPGDVARFLDSACEGDDVLRRRVEALLASHQLSGSFIETSAVGIATRIIESGQADLLVHRDINPGNIMLRPDGYVKVVDFGIAKLAEQEAPATMPKDEALLLVETNLGSILGTVPYISPEQACGVPVDKRTDIWSLGVVLYEMVTGHQPFTGGTPREVMTSILEKEPPPLTSHIKQTPAELRQIIGKALRKDRTERYQSVSEMLQALKNLRHKLELKAAPLWLRWTRSPIALVLVVTIAALALALPFYRHRNLATSLPPDRSIAVLPAKPINSANRDEIYEVGIADSLI